MLANVLLLLSAIFCVVACLVPNHYLPWPSFHGELCFGFGFSLLAMCGLSGRGSSRWPPAAVLALLLSLVPIGQYFFGLIPFSGTAVSAWFYLVAFALSILIGRNMLASQGEALLLSAALVVLLSALFTVALLLYQFLGWGFLGDMVVGVENGGRLRANLAQPNHAATFLFLGLVSAGFLYERRVLLARTYLILGGVFTVGVALTQSRTGFLECLLIPVVVFSYRHRISLRTRPVWLIVSFCLLVFLFFVFPFVQSVISLGGTEQGLNLRTGAGTRPEHWAMLLGAIGHAPFFGYGWDQVSVAHLRVLDEFPAITETQAHSHNIFFDLVLWNGVPIGFFVIICFLVWLFFILRQCAQMEALFLLVSMLGILLHGMLEYPLEYLYFLLPLGFMMGVLDAMSPGVFGGLFLDVRLNFSRALMLVVLVLGGGLARDYLLVEESYRSLRLDAGGFQQVSTYSTPKLHVLTNMEAFLKVASSKPGARMSAGDLLVYDAVLSRYPYPFLLLKGAVAYALNGEALKAERALRIICKRYPRPTCDFSLRQWQSWAARGNSDLQSIRLPAEI